MLRRLSECLQCPTRPVLAVQKAVGFLAVHDFAVQRIVLKGVTDKKGGDAQQNDFRQGTANVKAGKGLRSPFAGADPFGVVPRRPRQSLRRPLKTLELFLR